MTNFSIRLIALMLFMCVGATLLMVNLGKIISIPNNEIVFTATINTPEMHIYLMDIARQFIYDMKNVDLLGYEPAWSPDGNEIAYVGAGSKGFTIYKRDLDDRITQDLIHDTSGVNSPVWSADGQMMSYISFGSDHFSKLMLTDLQSGLKKPITNVEYHNNSHPAWSPDNRSIAFVSNEDTFGKSDINILDLQTGVVHPLFPSPENQFFPRWSPDGHYIAYISQGYNIVISVWDLQESKSYLLYNDLAQKGALDWSPDGRYIIYADFISYNHSGIFRLDVNECLDTTQHCQPQLITPTNGLFSNPRYRPNSP